MVENPKLEGMDSSCKACESDKTCSQKISVSDQTNTLQFTDFKSDSFVVDMERLSHLTDKDTTPNSRITLQRSVSKRGAEKKMNPSIVNEKENSATMASLPRAGPNTPEKPMVVTVGTMDRPMNPQAHHQITIMTGKVSATTGESRVMGRRSSFRRSPQSWFMDPRKILIFFATLSSVGTLLLIYFTLATGSASGDDGALN